jgi:hypothetical protein
MTPPLKFHCSQCLKPIGVALEHAGKTVTCPHCRQVVKAPTPADPQGVAASHALNPSAKPAEVGIAEQHAKSFTTSQHEFKELEDSIFGEAIEDDDEALFGLGSGKKGPAVDMPETVTTVARNTPLEVPPPTQRVTGLVPPVVPNPMKRIQPVMKVPLDEVDAQSFTASTKSIPRSNGFSADAANPFEMEAALPTQFSDNAPIPSVNSRRQRDLEPQAGPNWKLWIIIGLAGYSLLITIVAVWGWMRSPSAPPVKSDLLVPATQKAKPR